jgi:hypothetical protein
MHLSYDKKCKKIILQFPNQWNFSLKWVITWEAGNYPLIFCCTRSYAKICRGTWQQQAATTMFGGTVYKDLEDNGTRDAKAAAFRCAGPQINHPHEAV